MDSGSSGFVVLALIPRSNPGGMKKEEHQKKQEKDSIIWIYLGLWLDFDAGPVSACA